MGPAITIGLVVWILVAILVALVVGEMIRLRDRQCPDGTKPGASAPGTPVDYVAVIRTPLRWLRNKT